MCVINGYLLRKERVQKAPAVFLYDLFFLAYFNSAFRLICDEMHIVSSFIVDYDYLRSERVMHIPPINMKKFVTITDILTMLHCDSEHLPEADLWWLNPVIPFLFYGSLLWVAYTVNIQFWYDEGESIVDATDSALHIRTLLLNLNCYKLRITDCTVCVVTNRTGGTVNFLCETDVEVGNRCCVAYHLCYWLYYGSVL